MKYVRSKLIEKAQYEDMIIDHYEMYKCDSDSFSSLNRMNLKSFIKLLNKQLLSIEEKYRQNATIEFVNDNGCEHVLTIQYKRLETVSNEYSQDEYSEL